MRNEAGTSLAARLEYQVQGLSCPNCTREMQEEIRKLDYGKDASLLYNSGRLLVHPEVDLRLVNRILSKDGASLIVPKASEGLEEESKLPDGENLHRLTKTNDGVEENEDTPGKWLSGHWPLGLAAVFYLATFALDNFISSKALIPLYLISLVISGYPTFLCGFRNLTRLKFNMDTLMTVAITGAVLIGEWKEAVLVAILFGVNESLESYGMSRARQSVKALLDAAPKQAIVLRDNTEITVPVAMLQAGDTVIVRSGEKIPSDGLVLEGYSSVDEAAITGESIPVPKQPGSPVFGGSINTDGLLKITIEKTYNDSSLAKIMHLVQEAQDTKTPTELFIDKFAKFYTPVIMVIAVFIVMIPPLLFGEPWMKWLYEGLAILIVGCPCSLVLSSPIALISGMTRCARSGVLIKGGVHLEQLGKIDAIAFDKTGTLTTGRPAVIREVAYDPQRFHQAAGAIESGSLHPLAAAIMRHVAAKGASNGTSYGSNDPALTQLTDLVTYPGVGISADIDGTRYFAGSEKILEQASLPPAIQHQVASDLESLKAEGLTIVLIADNSCVLGLFGLADELRPESTEVVRKLHKAGIAHTVMLTGDHAGTAREIAAKSGVTDWFAGLLPEQKLEQVRKLSARWNIAMVGDGINDAPALAASRLGIAMGTGTDSAVETADIVLMQDHLGPLPGAIQIARRASRIISWNIGISLAFKLVALLLTIPGWLTLWIAVMSDMGATIIVTILGLTVLLGKDK